jgi:restriction system protein
MSVHVTRTDFKAINLNAVDPKACFRSLKGVGSSKLAGMAPVVPILRLNRSDDRFVAARDTISAVSELTNVAAISWEEFEYLVRDIFEKEFSKNGGEVKITRASRDHGVDAVAFDPDPIRGGKIVIQAKRYTNVVGVSAVRDLYGTLINDGANRGILVTTSQYGPDSYDFAKDKPITLLDGGNLLTLLDRHGHKARIDLAAAKRLGVSRDER